ncbi:MAG: DUF2141 domain-containing protein [Pseudomonadota bacterium]|mgnify:FL=1
MVHRLILAAGLLAGLSAPAQAAQDAAFTHVSCKGEPNEIRVTITNVKKDAGLMTVELYRNDPDGFLNKKGRLFKVRFAAHAPVTQFCVNAPEPGQWAMGAYHDRNANRRFDKNAFGLPAEPYGVSGNPKIHFALPPISEALFTVEETGASVEIRLKN